MKIVFNNVSREDLSDLAIWCKCGFLDYLKDEEVDNLKWIMKWADGINKLETSSYENGKEIEINF